MKRYAVVVNRRKSPSLADHFSPLFATPAGVKGFWLCTHDGAEVFQLWRNGHGYQIAISRKGESLIVAAEG